MDLKAAHLAVSAANKVESSTHQRKRRKKSNNWMKKMAEEAEIDWIPSDSEDSDGEMIKGKRGDGNDGPNKSELMQSWKDLIRALSNPLPSMRRNTGIERRRVK